VLNNETQLGFTAQVAIDGAGSATRSLTPSQDEWMACDLDTEFMYAACEWLFAYLHPVKYDAMAEWTGCPAPQRRILPSHMLSPHGAGQLEPASWSGFSPVWSGLPGPGARLEWLGPAGQLELLRPKPEARAPPPLPPFPPSHRARSQRVSTHSGKKTVLYPFSCDKQEIIHV
jgi:hypothetical protein